jgi:hypothetical protein
MTIAAPPAAFRAAKDAENAAEDRVLEDIYSTADLVRSLAISIGEAAYRRDRIFIRIYRAEFRELTVLLLGLIADLAPLEGEVTAAKAKGRSK